MSGKLLTFIIKNFIKTRINENLDKIWKKNYNNRQLDSEHERQKSEPSPNQSAIETWQDKEHI